MQISRRFTEQGQDVFASVEWVKRTSRITNADGSVVFEMTDAEVPRSWSQLATDIMVSKYFRKAGVPQFNDDGTPMLDLNGEAITGPERSARQVIHRLAGCWRHWGESHGYFESADDAATFYDELAYMMVHQMAAPNSPQWFNTGLNWAYGVTGPAQGHWVVDPATGRVQLAEDAYTHPQPHACFIQSVNDDLVNEGGIMDLWTREARLFKYGSGTGTNFSSLRGESEPLSGGGRSSGLMSFLKIGDRAAGAIKSGGTTRRAAKMVCLDADHPDIEHFVSWKAREELKVAAMVEGLKHLDGEQRELAEKLGLRLDYDFNGEAYYTVSGQNSNNSIRLTDEFFEAVDRDGPWDLMNRTNGEVAKTISARSLWDQVCNAAWRCADPGVQFDSTINAWHTCPHDGRINASNPCSEYMFLDNTACNLASLNLMKFYDAETMTFDLEGFEHGVSIWTVVLEVSVLMAAFPSRGIAEMSYKYRTLGLGYANLGAMLMQAGIPYDSDEGRAICACITSILTGRSYATSGRMAEEHGAYAGFEDNRHAMLRVIRNHRRAAQGVARDSNAYEDLRIRPVPIDHELVKSGRARLANATDMLERATIAWDDALDLGEKYGYRNAQVTVIAPTGTIGLLMDCDTTGVEPDFALTKFKKLAGGGYFKIANQSLRPALKNLGYDEDQIVDILTYVMGTLSLNTQLPTMLADRPGQTLRDKLADKGYSDEDLDAVSNQLPSVFELGFAFTAWSMPAAVLAAHGVTDIDAARRDPSFNGLELLGFEPAAIEQLNRLVCGTQTVEGAPHLEDAHLPIFDCASRCGAIGTRFIEPAGHIRMMAASQPFISGAISKTINLPNDADIEDINAAYWLSWELGLKANALYRDGSKLSQPLNSTASEAEDDDEADEQNGLDEALEEVSGEVATMATIVATDDADGGRTIEIDGATPTPVTVERVVERIIERPMRRRLPDTRRSITHRFNVAGHEGYLTAGLYESGEPGELFITMSKEGSTIGGIMDSLGTAISVALQYGVPLESLVKKFEHQRFEPMGMTTNRDVPFAKSLVDYIFRWMGMEFIPGYREKNAPPRKQRTDSTSTSATDTGTSSDASAATTATGISSSARDQVTEDNAWSSTRREASDDSGGTTPGQGDSAGNGDGTAPGTAPGTAMIDANGAARAPRHAPGGTTERRATSETMTVAVTRIEASTMAVSSLDQSAASMQGDAPACDVCGAITVRSGTCYKCLNCGNSKGCS